MTSSKKTTDHGLAVWLRRPGRLHRNVCLFLILVCCLFLAGCSGQTVMLAAFSPEVDAADSADREQVLEYLNLAVQDLGVIEIVLADADLDLLD